MKHNKRNDEDNITLNSDTMKRCGESVCVCLCVCVRVCVWK